MGARGKKDFDYDGFAKRLREARTALGITEEQAARAAGVSVVTWHRYERTGRGRITRALLNFSAVFSLSLDWVIAGDERMRPSDHLRLASFNPFVVPTASRARLQAVQP